MQNLEQVRRALTAKLGDEGKLVLLNARLILRTGVSLTVIDPRHAADAKRVGQVLVALREMGFDLRT